MSTRFGINNSNPDLVYVGDESDEQTNYPDEVYNDRGVIYYLDGVKTGWINQPEIKISYDPSVIRVR
jgi:hypothetical protein